MARGLACTTAPRSAAPLDRLADRRRPARRDGRPPAGARPASRLRPLGAGADGDGLFCTSPRACGLPRIWCFTCAALGARRGFLPAPPARRAILRPITLGLALGRGHPERARPYLRRGPPTIAQYYRNSLSARKDLPVQARPLEAPPNPPPDRPPASLQRGPRVCAPGLVLHEDDLSPRIRAGPRARRQRPSR